MAITGGFGVTIDTRTGTSRRWFIGRDDAVREELNELAREGSASKETKNE